MTPAYAGPMPSTMRAVVLDAPGPPSALQIRELPMPVARPGEVLIRVEAFGLNRSELMTRQGLPGAAAHAAMEAGEAEGKVVVVVRA
jgi:NADPH2:quinone reductase